MTDRVAFDFDNTLTTGDCQYWTGERPEPDPNMLDAVRDRYHAGDTVLIWTARPWSEAGQIAAHLTEWEVPYHAIRCEKGSADVYVDDKAVRPDEAKAGAYDRADDA